MDCDERGSNALSTNLPLEEWISVLTSEALVHAIIDRLAHHVLLDMNGRSYRLAHAQPAARGYSKTTA